MNLLVYVLGGLLLTWMAYLGYLWLSTQSVKGRPLDDRILQHLPDADRPGRRLLVYCYSEACPPCRQMTPLVDELRAQGHPIVKADLARDPELVRLLGVRATPTVLLVEKGQIREAVLGALSRDRLLKLLDAA